MSRVLVVSNDFVGKVMAGPGIRYYNLAKELAKSHDVTLLTPNEPDVTVPGVRLARASEYMNVRRLARDFDTIVTQRLSVVAMTYLARSPVRVIYDLYDPFMIESLPFFAEQREALRYRRHAYRATTLVQNVAIAGGDAFICASERQRDLWLGVLSALGRIDVEAYAKDRTLTNLIRVVPFGLEPQAPIEREPALKGVVPGIGVNDKVLLWGGGVWNWFDPLTIIRAVAELSKERDDVKLYFLGVSPPRAGFEEMDMTGRAVSLAEELGLKDRHVFFNFGWVPYEARRNYLLDADVGVSAHFEDVETRYSFRTRILDYFWAGLPTLTTEGDVLADLIRERDLGRALPVGDVDAWVGAIRELLDSPAVSRAVRTNVEAVRPQFEWPRVVEPLAELIDGPAGKNGRLSVTSVASRYVWFGTRGILTKRGVRGTAREALRLVRRPEVP
jgi:glycosyltransferase involved in cell wall biosynthesis